MLQLDRRRNPYPFTWEIPLFVFTAVANEAVWYGFHASHIACPKTWHWLFRKDVLTGLDIWMVFKLFVVMPLTSLYFVWQIGFALHAGYCLILDRAVQGAG